jgi:hypothetical protein
VGRFCLISAQDQHPHARSPALSATAPWDPRAIHTQNTRVHCFLPLARRRCHWATGPTWTETPPTRADAVFHLPQPNPPCMAGAEISRCRCGTSTASASLKVARPGSPPLPCPHRSDLSALCPARLRHREEE